MLGFDAARAWLRANTPEAAYAGAIATAILGAYSGALSAHDAIAVVIGAFLAFAVSESAVDVSASKGTPTPGGNP